MTTFTPKEVDAIRHMMQELSKYCREDLIGTILYTGAFRRLENGNSENDGAVLRLVQKLEIPKFKAPKARHKKSKKR